MFDFDMMIHLISFDLIRNYEIIDRIGIPKKIKNRFIIFKFFTKFDMPDKISSIKRVHQIIYEKEIYKFEFT